MVVLFWFRGVWVSLILLFIPPVLVSVLITLQILKGVKVLSFSQLPSSCDFSMLTRQVTCTFACLCTSDAILKWRWLGSPLKIIITLLVGK